MEKLITSFDLESKEIVAIVGSGGKTTLLSYFSSACCHEKVFAGTTTKLAFPLTNPYQRLILDESELLLTPPEEGITVAGNLVANGKKIGTLSDEVLQTVLQQYDKVFLECDGSKCLPLKGWQEGEPVIPSETTMTVGVLPLHVLGEEVSEERVHRLPLFLAITDTEIGDLISPQIFAKIIASSQGLFCKAQGRKILYFSHYEKEFQLMLAHEVIRELPNSYLDTLEKIIIGNTVAGRGKVLWENPEKIV